MLKVKIVILINNFGYFVIKTIINMVVQNFTKLIFIRYNNKLYVETRLGKDSRN